MERGQIAAGPGQVSRSMCSTEPTPLPRCLPRHGAAVALWVRGQGGQKKNKCSYHHPATCSAGCVQLPGSLTEMIPFSVLACALPCYYTFKTGLNPLKLSCNVPTGPDDALSTGQPSHGSTKHQKTIWRLLIARPWAEGQF